MEKLQKPSDDLGYQFWCFLGFQATTYTTCTHIWSYVCKNQNWITQNWGKFCCYSNICGPVRFQPYPCIYSIYSVHITHLGILGGGSLHPSTPQCQEMPPAWTQTCCCTTWCVQAHLCVSIYIYPHQKLRGYNIDNHIIYIYTHRYTCIDTEYAICRPTWTSTFSAPHPPQAHPNWLGACPALNSWLVRLCGHELSARSAR